MLSCPRCATNLKALRYGPKAIWGCDRCGGRAGAFALLRESIPTGRWQALRRAIVGAEVAMGPPCPSCRHAMLVAHHEGAEVDACRRCQLLWFDRGETPEPRPRPAPLSPEAAEALVRFQGIDEDEDLAALLNVIPGRQSLPVELDSSFATIPLATSLLAVLMIAIGLLADGTAWIGRYGFLPQEPFRDAGITLFTHFFVHGGAWHLAVNAYFLVVFGDNVEESAGRAGLVVLALLGAAGGALLDAAADPRRPFPLIGAGAGISALLAYYALRFPRARIGWWFMNLPAWGFVLLWALFQTALAPFELSPALEFSLPAHVGGAAVGVAFWMLQRRMSPWTSKASPPS